MTKTQQIKLLKKQQQFKFTLSPLWRVTFVTLDLSRLDAFCITSNHLEVKTKRLLLSLIYFMWIN